MGKFLKFLILIGILVGTHMLWMPYVGTLLLVPDKLEKADSMYVLRGNDYYRIEKAGQLLKEKWAPWILTSATPSDTNPYDLDHKITGLDKLGGREIVKRYYEYFGIDPQKVLFAADETTSTFTEAVEARKVLMQSKARSMILVTSGYHMRRALWIFNKVFENSGIQIYHVTAKEEGNQPQLWWQRERDVRTVESEYGAFLVNFFYHFVFRKVSTSFDSV